MKKGEKYIIEIGEVEHIKDDNGISYPLARIKGFSALTFDEKGLDRLKKIDDSKPVEAKKLYNCKFVVTDNDGVDGLTVGKVYELKNGAFYDDVNALYPLWKEIYSFKDLKEFFKNTYSLCHAKILEIKE